MKKFRFILAVIGCVLLSAAHPRAASPGEGERIKIAGRDTVYWAPGGSSGKQPLILFSHGFAACATQSDFLEEALAKRGYWVFSPEHDDAGCGPHAHDVKPVASFNDGEGWNDTTYVVRAEDLRKLLAALQQDPRFRDRIDFSRIGLAGHSLGGYAILGLVGAWPEWKPLPGVKAVLALSPFSQPFLVQHTLGGIKVPVMYQGGTRDGNTPPIEQQGGSYDETHAPKYFVELDRANHFAWTNMNHRFYVSVIIYSTAFFDHYLKGLPATPALTKPRGDVAELRYDSELGKSDFGRDEN